jgi:XTP/dITP diphosphohydrolase
VHLLIATHNRGKLVEYQELLAGLPFELSTLDDLGILDDVDETGTTFAENAALKAHAFAQRSGLLTLADDSGLQVDALGGEPGVYSKRYAGENATDAQRIDLMLRKLRDVPVEARTARFRCVIVIATPDGRARQAEGTVEGRIGFVPRGTNGFGYDPIFIVSDTDRTMAELPAAEKNKISHRARAMQAARPLLAEFMEQT